MKLTKKETQYLNELLLTSWKEVEKEELEERKRILIRNMLNKFFHKAFANGIQAIISVFILLIALILARYTGSFIALIFLIIGAFGLLTSKIEIPEEILKLMEAPIENFKEEK